MSNTTNAYVGRSLPRRDALDKVTGRGLFTSDLSLPGMLHGKILRSPHPHARIVRIDASAALAMRGVRAVATHENTSTNLYNGALPMFTTVPGLERVLDQRIFDDTVRYVGDEVAAVAADTVDIAEAALEAIKVEYELLPFVLDPFEAMRPEAPELHPGKGITPCGHNVAAEIIRIQYGLSDAEAAGEEEIRAALAACHTVIEESFQVPIVKQVQLETMCALAKFDADGSLTVWSTTQTPHPTRFILASIFDIPAGRVRVLAPPYVGGGFGSRIGLSAKAEPIAVALAKLARRPVKVWYSRDEDFSSSDTRHGGRYTVRLGADKNGRFQALDLRSVLATGAYCTFGAEVPAVSGAQALAVYDIAKKFYNGRGIYTNQTPAGAFRGFGNPQSNFALEATVDLLADALGKDPLELRRQNISRDGEPWSMPYRCSTNLAGCMEKGAEAIGWERRKSFDNSGPVKRGLGLSVATWGSNAQPFCVDFDNAFLMVQVDGSVHLAAGTPEIGSGSSTTLPQIAADAFGVKPEEIFFSFGDTLSSPFSIGSHASRTLFSVGLAVKMAAEDARGQVLDYAALMLHKNAADLDLRDGNIFLKDDPKAQALVTLAELCYHAHLRNRQFIGVGRMLPPNSPPWHACFADVSVDTETGMVTVNRLVAAHDVGTAVNPQIVEGQIEGGAMQAFGYSLTEEIVYDAKTGRQRKSKLHDYMLPTFADLPEITAIIVPGKDPQGPFGAKGVGECGAICPGSAIANAVSHALGVRVRQLPMLPERILGLLQ